MPSLNHYSWALESACKPSSVPPASQPRVAAISLGRRLPGASSDRTRSTLPCGNPGGQPSSPRRRKAEPIWSCSEWGFPGPPITRGTGELLPRRFTLTSGTSPHFAERPGAVCFLWHYPSRRQDSALRSTLPYGARTFLPPRLAPQPATARPAPTPARTVPPATQERNMNAADGPSGLST